MQDRDSALHATLPALDVAAHGGLGYASTVHTALPRPRGRSADPAVAEAMLRLP